MTAQGIEKPKQPPLPFAGPNGPPPLQPGDYLTRTEFEYRCHAHPEVKKAELIEGIVYMPSPGHTRHHTAPHFDIITWLGFYRLAAYGVTGNDNATLRLDNLNEPQPDALLRLEPSLGGKSSITEDDYLAGTPELIVEIAASSASYDMHQKKDAYARHGVQEYVVVQVYEREMVWFVLRQGVYKQLEPDNHGILRSEVFPGLCLQPTVFWENDMATVMAVLQEGLASPEHAAYTERLQGSHKDV